MVHHFPFFDSKTFLFCLSYHQYFYEQKDGCQQVEPTLISPKPCLGSYQQNNKSPPWKGNNKMTNLTSLILALKLLSAVTSRSGIFQFIPGTKEIQEGKGYFPYQEVHWKIEPLHTCPLQLQEQSRYRVMWESWKHLAW